MSQVVVMSPEELEALVRRVVQEASPASGPPAPEVLTREQAAKLLDVHPNVLSRYVRELGLPAHRVGGEWRLLRAEVMAWVKAQDLVKGAA